MLDLQGLISKLRADPVNGKYFAEAFQLVENAVNQGAQQIGIDPTGELPAPPPIQSLTAKASGGYVHLAIQDNNAISKNIQYFVEYSNDPSFSGAHVLDLGAARTHPPIPLPAKDDGGNAQSWYFRAYSQYHGSAPGKKVLFGGTTPTPVSPGGTTQLTLLPSTGSGTAAPDGSQAGLGIGRDLSRLPVGPKRGPVNGRIALD